MAFPTTTTLEQIIEPILTAHHLDFEDLKTTKAGAKSAVLVKVGADSPPDLDLLETVSKEIGEKFDVEEQCGQLNFGAGYSLEVSTMGVDTPLTKPRHWRRNRGKMATITQDGVNHKVRIGALNDDETAVIVIARKSKELVVETVELAKSLHAVVEIEFAKPAREELDLAECTFGEALKK